jgi:hypothetical protein
MTDRIDPSAWPTPRGPWPEVTNLGQVFDHGRGWCINAAGHPGEAGYPDPARHLPWDECHGPQGSVGQARSGLTGDPLEVSVYMAAPYRFGAHREPTDTAPRLIVETASADGRIERFSLGPGEALRLARMIGRLVDDVTMPMPIRQGCVVAAVHPAAHPVGLG